MQSFTMGESNRYSVLQKTYALLAATLLWSAGAAVVGAGLHFTIWGYVALVVLGFATLFGALWFRDSALGLLMVFVFTGAEGLSLGPVLQHYLHLHNGAHILALTTGLTGALFLSLSGYVLVSRKDFSFLGGFLFAGLVTLILLSVVGMFFHMAAFELALSAMGVLLFSGYILYDTSDILSGRQTSYVVATVELYLDFVNLFLDILRLVAAFSGNDD